MSFNVLNATREQIKTAIADISKYVMSLSEQSLMANFKNQISNLIMINMLIMIKLLIIKVPVQTLSNVY